MNDFGQQEGQKMIFLKKNKRNNNFLLNVFDDVFTIPTKLTNDI